ncbi:MAG: putative tRNA threonylcarbamoyladenosine biosynthesis protein Gcp [Parcubacteria group bacterium GW2011_GWB1_45_9]|nr:MAG: putative tRNA threonylcarbamoyladenosine biosynthesis protein Gcp [Parcubacteria group bacterium GW2011_GWB1_45_9]
MRILAIETSCDETAIAVVDAKGGLKRPRFKIVANEVASQIKIHRPFGGVVPNLAKREHIKNLPILFKRILKAKGLKLKADIIAVTVGPGLEPALWTGINFAKELAKKYKKPLIGVNHMEGHLYSNWFLPVREIQNSKFKIQTSIKTIVFPAIVLVVSGGHTILLKMDSVTKRKKLGETRDDAAGEAYDKVARLLDLPYPGGPEIEKIAKRGNSEAVQFPRPMLNQKNYDLSFSGLKTAVLYYLRDNPLKAKSLKLKADIAASFQQAAIDVLVAKTMNAAKEYKAKSVMLCGGVAANKALRKELKIQSLKFKADFYAPEFALNTDNAAMIAAAGYVSFLKKKKLRLTAQSNLSL